MAGTRTTDSFAEGLHKMLQSVTDLKTTDDADLPFAINLETMILQRLKQGASAAMQGQPPSPPQGQPSGLGMAQAMTPGPGVIPPGMPPGPGGMPMGPPGPGVGPAPVPGLMAGPNFPNPDELRRALTTGTTASRLNSVASRLAGLV